MKNKFCLFLLSILLTQLSFSQDKISKGSKVTILEIGASDAYYAERAGFVGSQATAIADLNKNASGFYSGTIETDKGRTCFFTAIKLTIVSGPDKPTTTTQFMTGTIKKGTPAYIAEISSDDSYYSKRFEKIGKKGKIGSSDVTMKEDGYYSGSFTYDDGSSDYFYEVKFSKEPVVELNKTTSNNSETKNTTATASSSPVNFITGTIKKGTPVYVAEISSDDSYYSDRSEKVGKKGVISKSDLSMKEDGWYAGDFTYDDGSTAYFYRVKFSKEPVQKLVNTSKESKDSDADPFGFGDLLGWSDDFSFVDEKDKKETGRVEPDRKQNTSGIWSTAQNDKQIKEGDKVEITAISPDDSYYEDREDYIGKIGIAGDDLEFQDDEYAYGGTVKLDGGDSPYFYLVKLKKISKSNTSSPSTSTQANMPKVITKNTKIKITEVGPEDSYYAQRNEYIGKTGKVAESLNLQSDGYYSGEIYFDYGKEVYFFNIKVSIIK